MDIRIEKVDINNNEVINFLIEENLKLFLEFHHKYSSVYNGKHRDYMKERFKELFLSDIDEEATIYAAYLEDRIVGCGFIDGIGYLNSLFVKEEYRKQQIGTKILEELIQECSRFDVIRVDARLEAISLYKRFSFHETGERKSENSIVMILERSHYEK